MSNLQIAQAVSELADVLDSYGISSWAERLRKELDGLHAGDEQTTRTLLSYFGHMGSLDDLIITPANGHPVSESQGEVATRELRRHLENLLQAGLPIRRTWPVVDAGDG